MTRRAPANSGTTHMLRYQVYNSETREWSWYRKFGGRELYNELKEIVGMKSDRLGITRIDGKMIRFPRVDLDA